MNNNQQQCYQQFDTFITEQDINLIKSALNVRQRQKHFIRYKPTCKISLILKSMNSNNYCQQI